MKTWLGTILSVALLVTGCNENDVESDRVTPVTDDKDRKDQAKQEANSSKKDDEQSEPKAPPLDRKDAAATAKVILTAYKDMQLGRVAELCTSGNKSLFAEIAEKGVAHPRYASIFTGWRWDAVRNWGGEIGEVRYRNNKTAAVKFGDINPREVAVVMLEWEDGGWCFEDINSPGKSDFEELKAERPE